MSLLGKNPLQFKYKIGSEGRALVFWFIASIVCLESKVQRKGKSNKNASYQTAIDFAHSAILGMEGEKRGSFHKYPNHSISSFCKSVWKKGKKKFPCLSSMCHNHSLSRKNIKRILSSQQPFQFFGLLSNFKKKVKKNFLNFKGFFPNGIFGSNL